MANIYVNHTGSSTPPYNTETKACTNIQTALDAAVSGDTVWIKADQDYIMNGTDQQAAQFDVDVNSNVAIKGYYSTIGDQDYGGAYYKDTNHGWTIIDANNGSYHVFSAGNKDNIRFHNLKFVNVNSSKYALDLTPTAMKYGYLVKNCSFAGGSSGIYINYLHAIIISDCKFTGTYGSYAINSSNASYDIIIEFCEFSHGDATGSLYFYGAYAGIVQNCIFNINGTVTYLIRISSYCYALIENNTIYENTGGNITNGIYAEATTRCSNIVNNIITGCTISINEITTGLHLGGWNCLYNNGSNWTLHISDIISDPQFMDATNGDFRLKPTSPCLNTGKPTLGSGYTSMGAWQRKSLLR
jgi:hypothetical protein